MARISMNLPEPLNTDFRAYCKKNALQFQELLRHLIRIEIYQEKSLSKGGVKIEIKK